MGESNQQERGEDELRQEIIEAVNRAKERGMNFDRPDEEIVTDLVKQWKKDHPEQQEAPQVPYVEWDPEKGEFTLVDKPKEFGSDSSKIGFLKKE